MNRIVKSSATMQHAASIAACWKALLCVMAMSAMFTVSGCGGGSSGAPVISVPAQCTEACCGDLDCGSSEKCCSGACYETFMKTYSGAGTGTEWFSAAKQTSDAAFIAAGWTSTASNGEDDMWVVRIDKDGNKVWESRIGGTGEDKAYDVIATTDGGFLAVGGTDSYGYGDMDAIFIKYNAEGARQWIKMYGAPGMDDSLLSVVNGIDGGYVAAGVTYSQGINGDAWVFKLSDSGATEWSRSLGGTGYDYAHQIIVADDNNGYVIAGQSLSNSTNDSDAWLAKIDRTGFKLWDYSFGTSVADFALGVSAAPGGGYFLTGPTYRPVGNHTNADIMVLSADTNGRQLWMRTIEGSKFERGLSTAIGKYGEMIALGYTYSPELGANSSDVLMVAYDGLGNEIWRRLHDLGHDDLGYYVSMTTDGGFIIAGTSTDGNDNYDALLIKTAPDGRVRK